jgi:hypothetical protein
MGMGQGMGPGPGPMNNDRGPQDGRARRGR